MAVVASRKACAPSGPVRLFLTALLVTQVSAAAPGCSSASAGAHRATDSARLIPRRAPPEESCADIILNANDGAPSLSLSPATLAYRVLVGPSVWVRDILLHEELGVHRCSKFTASVRSHSDHSVVRVVLSPVERAPIKSDDVQQCAAQAPGRCYRAPPSALIATVPPNFNAEGCCKECRAWQGARQCESWTYSKQRPHSCLLYAGNATLESCAEGTVDGASGWRTTLPPPLPPPPAPTPAPKGSPNVLFIAIDDLRPQLNCYGHNDTRTPHLDRFASESLLFENAHAQIAHCSPSRNSLMSGRTPDHVKVWNFLDDFRDPTTGGRSIVTLPEYFRRNGYFTTGSGKVFHPAKPPNYDQLHSWSEKYLDPLDHKDAPGVQQCQVKSNPRTSWYPCSNNSKDEMFADNFMAVWAKERMAKLVQSGATAAHDKPFFMAVGVHKPHLPYFYPPDLDSLYPPVEDIDIPPAEALETPKGMPPVAWMQCMGRLGEEGGFVDFVDYNLTQPRDPDPGPGPATAPIALVKNITRGYMLSVTYVDSQVGIVLDSLETQGLKADTVVAIWGDHGQNLGEHNTYCKMTLFESATRVPLLIRSPLHPASAGKRTNAPAQLLDMYPTLAMLAGLPKPPSVDGVDLSALLGNPTRTDVSEGAFSQQARCFQKDAPTPRPSALQASRTRMMTCEFVSRDRMDYMGYSVRTTEWRYSEWAEWDGAALKPRWASVERELYDHRASTMPAHGHPGWRENENLASHAEHAGLVVKLSAMLRAHFG